MDPDDLERKMAAMRSALGDDVREFATRARTLVDWRNHFRAHPWLYCGAAATVGFLLVPRPDRPLKITAEIVPDEQGGHRLLVERPRSMASATSGLTGSLMRLATSFVMREAVSYLKSHLLEQVTMRMSAADNARRAAPPPDRP